MCGGVGPGVKCNIGIKTKTETLFGRYGICGNFLFVWIFLITSNSLRHF